MWVDNSKRWTGMQHDHSEASDVQRGGLTMQRSRASIWHLYQRLLSSQNIVLEDNYVVFQSSSWPRAYTNLRKPLRRTNAFGDKLQPNFIYSDNKVDDKQWSNINCQGITKAHMWLMNSKQMRWKELGSFWDVALSQSSNSELGRNQIKLICS